MAENKKEISAEEAIRLKRILWAHKSDLEWVFPDGQTRLIGAINYRFEVLYDGDRYDLCHFKPILRTLYELTDEEIKTVCKMEGTILGTIEDIKTLIKGETLFMRTLNYLFSLGVDAYGLITAGYAISLTEAKKKGWVQ